MRCQQVNELRAWQFFDDCSYRKWCQLVPEVAHCNQPGVKGASTCRQAVRSAMIRLSATVAVSVSPSASACGCPKVDDPLCLCIVLTDRVVVVLVVVVIFAMPFAKIELQG